MKKHQFKNDKKNLSYGKWNLNLPKGQLAILSQK